MSELDIVSGVQSFMTSSPLAVATAIFLARWLVFGYVLFGISLVTSPRREDRHAVGEAAWSAGLALALTTLIAYFVGRLRPYMLPFDPSAPVSLLIPGPLNSSFPSGHTAVSFAIAAAILYANRKAGILAVLVAVLVAFGRMSAGVHFPTDILGGMLVGVVSFAIVRTLHGQIRTSDIERSAKKHKHPKT
jgi:undecaprenyl-diphosphatase